MYEDKKKNHDLRLFHRNMVYFLMKINAYTLEIYFVLP